MDERDISKAESGITAVFDALRAANDRVEELEYDLKSRAQTIEELEERVRVLEAEAVEDRE